MLPAAQIDPVDLDGQLPIENRAQTTLAVIIERLLDIANNVASEAESATRVVRGVSSHVHRVAALATTMENTADAVDRNVRSQAEALSRTRAALNANKPAIEALSGSAMGVADISRLVSTIARESRILSLNARIEATRSGNGDQLFVVIAQEMSLLSDRTKQATDEIGKRTEIIARDVSVANDVVLAHGNLVAEQDAVLSDALSTAHRQRETAALLAEITAESVGPMDQAAAAIGRVGVNAIAMKVLARELVKLANDLILTS